MEQFRSFLGLAVLIFIAWIFSSNRRRFPWRIVIWGLGLQVILCLLVLGIPRLGISGPLLFLFEGANFFVNRVIDFTLEGSRFLFGDLLKTEKVGYIFALQVLPTIIFVGALMSVFYYFGIMQKITWGMAYLMQRSLKTSGAETLAASANIFVGQTEAPLVIKPYVATMTRSELLCLMIGGMANTAGGVLAAFVGLLRDRNPDIAGHLLVASILSAPAALLITKVLVPETETPVTAGDLPKDRTGEQYSNALDAACAGASDGLQLALNVGAMLIAFIALIAMINSGIGLLGDASGLNTLLGRAEPLSLQVMLGWVFAPIAFIVGIPANEMFAAGVLLGEKTVLNEFVAYVHLSEQSQQFSDRGFLILSYALSGFANFSSIAIQIGGISPLAPHRRKDLAALGFKALLGGTLATLMTAALVGVII